MDSLRFDIYLILKVPLLEHPGLAYTSPVQDLLRRGSSAADLKAGSAAQLLFRPWAGAWGVAVSSIRVILRFKESTWTCLKRGTERVLI